MKQIHTAYGEISVPENTLVTVYSTDGKASENLYPAVLSVRNGWQYGADAPVLLLLPKSALQVTEVEAERIRTWALINIPGWNDLFDKEIHVICPGLPGLYADNYMQPKSLDEYKSAPEIGIFPFPILAPAEENKYHFGITQPKWICNDVLSVIDLWRQPA